MNDADTFSKVDLQEKLVTITEKRIKLSCGSSAAFLFSSHTAVQKCT